MVKSSKVKVYRVILAETRVYHKVVTVRAESKESAQRAAITRRGITSESQLLTGKTQIVQNSARVKG